MGRKSCKSSKKAIREIFNIAIFIILAIGALRLGAMGGDMLRRSDFNLMKNISTEYYKSALNYALPIIDIMYNSGHVSISITSELKKVVKGMFNFEFDAPITIINAHSPMLYTYYYDIYQPKMALEEKNKESQEKSSAPVPQIIDKRADANEIEAIPENENSSSIISDGSIPEKITTDKNVEKITSNGKVIIQQLEGTSYNINIDEILKEPLKLNFEKNGPKALIYHTHTTEAYLKSINDLNRKDLSERTTNNEINVIRTGEELSKWLKQYGIGTIHNGTNHIEKSDIGAYERSYNTIKTIQAGNPSLRMFFDIHRDATGDGQKLREIIKINGKNVAKIMFVVGTNKNLSHPNWKENLKFSVKLQKYLEDNYPGITRPIYVSCNRYNENISNAALIVEVGGDGNTADEAAESMKYLAKAISEVMKMN